MKPTAVYFCLDHPLAGMYLTVTSMSGDEDHVVWVTDPDDPGEWPCDCEGYKFRSYCSHQERAWDAFCQWVSHEAPEHKKCPQCGGPTDRIWSRPHA